MSSSLFLLKLPSLLTCQLVASIMIDRIMNKKIQKGEDGLNFQAEAVAVSLPPQITGLVQVSVNLWLHPDVILYTYTVHGLKLSAISFIRSFQFAEPFYPQSGCPCQLNCISKVQNGSKECWRLSLLTFFSLVAVKAVVGQILVLDPECRDVWGGLWRGAECILSSTPPVGAASITTNSRLHTQ